MLESDSFLVDEGGQVEELSVVSFIISAFVAGVSVTLPPGPIFAMTVTESARRGFRAGMLVVLGHAFVELAVVVALALGLGVFMGSDTVKIVISILGGSTLVWTGSNLLRSAHKPAGAKLEMEGSERDAYVGSLMNGVLAAVVNPFFIVWWTVVGGAFTLRGLEVLGFLGPMIFLFCHWASDFPWFGLISFSVGRGRMFLGRGTHRLLIGACGIFLIALGLIFIWDGATLLVKP